MRMSHLQVAVLRFWKTLNGVAIHLVLDEFTRSRSNKVVMSRTFNIRDAGMFNFAVTI